MERFINQPQSETVLLTKPFSQAINKIQTKVMDTLFLTTWKGFSGIFLVFMYVFSQIIFGFELSELPALFAKGLVIGAGAETIKFVWRKIAIWRQLKTQKKAPEWVLPAEVQTLIAELRQENDLLKEEIRLLTQKMNEDDKGSETDV